MRRLRLFGVGSSILWLLASGCASSTGQPKVVEAPTPKISSAHLQSLNLQLIEKMEAEKKWYAAISYLDRYRQSFPASDQGDLLRAKALAATGSTEKAQHYFRKVLGGALAAQGYQGLGLLSAQEGQRQAAIHYFAEASRHDPINADILNNLGFAYLQNKNWPQAKVALFRAGELAPGDARIWSNVALYYLLRNETYQAQEVISTHQLGWHTQQLIHREATRLMGGQTAPAQTPATNAEIPAPFPNQPLTQMFSAHSAPSTNTSRTAP